MQPTPNAGRVMTIPADLARHARVRFSRSGTKIAHPELAGVVYSAAQVRLAAVGASPIHRPASGRPERSSVTQPAPNAGRAMTIPAGDRNTRSSGNLAHAEPIGMVHDPVQLSLAVPNTVPSVCCPGCDRSARPTVTQPTPDASRAMTIPAELVDHISSRATRSGAKITQADPIDDMAHVRLAVPDTSPPVCHPASDRPDRPTVHKRPRVRP